MDNIFALSTFLAAIILAALGIGTIYILNIPPFRINVKRMPIGPKPLPFVGNLWDVPKASPWYMFTEWGKQYGDVVYIRVLGQHIVILNSLQVATDLLEKRSHIYSDRPPFPMLELCGWDINMGFMRYGSRWRVQRRIFHQEFRAEMTKNYWPILQLKVQSFMQSLHETPDEFAAHLRHYVSSVIMHATYGYHVSPKNDRMTEVAEEAGTLLSEAFLPRAAIVNIFPLLKYLPSWFPGADFQRLAAKCRHLLVETQDVPFQFVNANLASGNAIPCMVSRLIERSVSNGKGVAMEENIKAAGTTAFAAGADTIVSALKTFFLAMVLYPEAQKRAQAEIDAIVGNQRLPDFEDRESLPYVEAYFRELFRWHPVVPLGVPHAVIEEDIYNDQLIPKGATVIANIWAMTRNYTDPDTFKPERFLTKEGKLDPDSAQILAFGFGRRVCVARHMAQATVWIAVVSTLALFTVSKPKDAAGREISIPESYTDGGVSHPHPFKCTIIPRHVGVRRLVQ